MGQGKVHVEKPAALLLLFPRLQTRGNTTLVRPAFWVPGTASLHQALAPQEPPPSKLPASQLTDIPRDGGQAPS